MEKLLNQYLADLVVEYHKLQNFHWYVKGSDFFVVHAKLEELYNGINAAIDEVAEAILMDGGRPLATLSDFLKNAKIKEVEAKDIRSSEIFEIVSEDFSYLLASAKAIKAKADDDSNYNVSAMMDPFISEYSKMLWMIRSLK